MKRTKKLLALALALGMLLSLSAAAFASDLDGHESREAIQAFLEKGYLKGYPDGSVQPDQPMTRAEFAALVNRIAGFEARSSRVGDFGDVAEDAWYWEELAVALAAGYLPGTADGRMDPGGSITAAEVDAVISRLLGVEGEETSTEALTRAQVVSLLYANLEGIEGKGVKHFDLTPEYSNIPFDYAEQIAADREALTLIPAAPELGLTVADEKGASGVVLQAASDVDNRTDLYLNALVAGNRLTLTAEAGIASAESSAAGTLEISGGGSVSFVPAAIMAMDPADEVITLTLTDGREYRVHTVNELMPVMKITGAGVDEANQGVYTFTADKFLLRVATTGELLYYRNMLCTGECMAEGFAPQVNADGTWYSLFVELHPEYRNANGGFSSGMYLIMDENYTDAEELTLLPNRDPNHGHGAGYLDQHELVMLGKGHYLLLSYIAVLAENLPATVRGIDGGRTGYVWENIFQEVKNGEVVNEINTSDYPLLYDSAVEKNDYAGSTTEGIDVTVGQNTVHSYADGVMDYCHSNSLDYVLDAGGNLEKLLVSMRDQSAVYQFDVETGAIDWILGGKASTLGGYEEYTGTRTDDMGIEFQALTFGQHYARYVNRAADGTLSGKPVISLFDNHTGMAPFLTALPVPTLTRTFKAEIDAGTGTATLSDVIDGTALNEKSEGYHIASHCGSVDYSSATGVVIGWGLHGVIDNIGAFAPQGTISDRGYDDLRQGSRPVFSEYDMTSGELTFELSVTRNPLVNSHEALFSYRTYKSVA